MLNILIRIKEFIEINTKKAIDLKEATSGADNSYFTKLKFLKSLNEKIAKTFRSIDIEAPVSTFSQK